MEDEVEPLGQQVHMVAEGLFHAALDAVAFMRLADHLADREADPRTRCCAD